MAQVRLITGPVNAARQGQIDKRFLEVYPNVTLILPSRALTRERSTHIIQTHDLPGFLGAPILDLSTFATQLLEQAGIRVNALTSLERQRLLQRCIHQLAAADQLDMLKVAPDTAGLINHLLQIITQLKQAAIDPETFAQKLLSRADATDEDILISRVYTAYQEQLRTLLRHDVPGLFWEATLQCEGARPALIPEGHTLLLDGFDDFTPSEFRFLQALEPHLDTLVFGINYDDRPGRLDCHALTQRTVQQIRKAFDVTPITIEAPAPDTYSQYAAEHIFWRDPPKMPDNLRANIRIQACHDEQHELESCARTIKHLLLTTHTQASDMAITARSLKGMDERIGPILQEFGIPLRTPPAAALIKTPQARRLLQVLQLNPQSPRDTILTLLTDVALPWEDDCDPAVCATFDRLSRHAHALVPYTTWTTALSSLAQRLEKSRDSEINHLKQVMPHVGECIVSMQQRLQTLAAWIKPFNKAQAMGAWVQATCELLQGIAKVNSTDEENILRALYQLLAQLDDGDATPLDNAAYTAILSQALGQSTYTLSHPAQGITLLPLEQLRNRHFKHLFMLSLNDGAIPQHPNSNALYEIQDFIRLQDAGIALEGHQEHREREMLLFHHGLAAAQDQLYLSWCLHRGRREASPSPYLAELKALFPEEVLLEAPLPTAESILPTAEHTASPRDLCNVVVHRFPGQQKQWPILLNALNHPIAVEGQRQQGQPFEHYDGQLQDPTIIDGIARRYDGTHCYSANQLQSYLNCPFSFFLERILQVQDIPLPEPGFDHRVRGLILHDALEDFHRWLSTEPNEDLLSPAAEAQMNHALDKAFEKHEWKSRSASPGIIQAEHSNMARKLHQYRNIEAQRKEAQDWNPIQFECSFGMAHATSDDPLSTIEPYHMDTPLGPIPFSGRIDRIDQHKNDPASYRIIDYKTGALPGATAIREGQNIQLTLYALYLEQITKNEGACKAAYYLTPGKTARQEGLHIDGKYGWDKREENARKKIVHAIEAIRAGVFPPLKSGATCYGCSSAHICRYEKSRIERKLEAMEEQAGKQA